jgi:vacuolar-type H+-ATPase subunit E/Vma4
VPKIRQIFKDVQLVFEEKDIIGGVIIESLDGKVNYNMSLEALLDTNFEGIKEEILEELGDG